MIGPSLCTETPENIVAVAREIRRFVSFRAITPTARADRLATTIVIGNQVVPFIRPVTTGSHPRNRRCLGTRRTRFVRPAATGAEGAAERTLAPVLTRLPIS